jgi:hypothetical protein
VSIDRIYLSKASPIGDPYDSEADLKEFYGKVVIPANTSITLSDTQPDVRYDLDEGQPLLIAVDFSPSLGNPFQGCGTARAGFGLLANRSRSVNSGPKLGLQS